ncbi:hypothetical protein ACET3Z_013737 [Daucus carota]
MGKPQKLSSILWLCHLTNLYFISSASSSCLVDFGYVNTLPWKKSTCTDQPIDKVNCCQTIQSLLGVGLAKYLNKTSMFYFPDSQTATSCMSDFNRRLTSLSINVSCTSGLYDELVVNRTSNCGGITTLEDWKKEVGLSELDSTCNGELLTPTRCNACSDAGQRVAPTLASMKANSTRCFFYTCLYAAGIVNQDGPEDIATASCILGLAMVESASKKKNVVYKIVFGSLGAILGVLTTWGLIILYQKLKEGRRLAALREEYVRGVKAKVLPNTGAKWFHVDELEQATKGFSKKNLIGQGGFGVVYKGTLLDGTIVAVKQLLDMDINGDDQEFTNEAEIISKIRHRNLLALRGFCVTSDASKGNVDGIFDIRMGESGSKAVMERFVHVGILCAHVMVALRPTISEALKMLEGDVEVPMLPDRPLPLSHESLRYIPQLATSTVDTSGGRSSLGISGSRSSSDISKARSSI